MGLPWKAPELLEQNCHGFGTKIDIYRYCLFVFDNDPRTGLSLGIFACEIVNGSIPFLDKAPTLIMLEKLKGSQPLVMDRTTLDEHLGDGFDLYLKAEAKLLKKYILEFQKHSPQHKAQNTTPLSRAGE